MTLADTTIAILGASGMLGSALVGYFQARGYRVVAIQRNTRVAEPSSRATALHTGVDAADAERLRDILRNDAVTVLVNAVGIVKQLPEATNAVRAITINAPDNKDA